MIRQAVSSDEPPPERLIHVVQGECRVSADPGVVLTTTLGSCVAACIRDPVARVGGMNHFLLPEGPDGEGLLSLRYGAFSMELLINGLLAKGARRERLEAKLFGGSRLSEALSDVGGRNAAFARDFLHREGIPVRAESLGGPRARKVQYWPVSGRARQLLLARAETMTLQLAPPRRPTGGGDVELF